MVVEMLMEATERMWGKVGDRRKALSSIIAFICLASAKCGYLHLHCPHIAFASILTFASLKSALSGDRLIWEYQYGGSCPGGCTCALASVTLCAIVLIWSFLILCALSSSQFDLVPETSICVSIWALS